MSRLIDLTGKKYGLLTVIKRAKNSKTGQARWECLCDCGNTTYVMASNLKNMQVKSCGCLRGKKNTHHLSNTRLYKIWTLMKRRCADKKMPYYKNYGGRGITVCDEWINNFLSFREWALKNGYREGLTIERIDNNKGYSPKNCTWISKGEQQKNRRMNYKISYHGEKKCLAEWCEEFNLDYKRTHNRIYKLGWDFEKALLTPVNEKKRNKETRKKYERIYIKSDSTC